MQKINFSMPKKKKHNRKLPLFIPCFLTSTIIKICVWEVQTKCYESY